jgi:hypothetical protein
MIEARPILAARCMKAEQSCTKGKSSGTRFLPASWSKVSSCLGQMILERGDNPPNRTGD